MNVPYLYIDGRRPGQRPVQVELGAEGLRLVDETGILVAFWAYEELDLLESSPRKSPFRIVHRRYAQACIITEDRQLLQTLAQICPRIEERTASPTRHVLSRLSLLLLAALCGVWFLSLSVGFLAGPLSGVIPPTWERQLGTQIAKRMTEQTGVCSYTPGVKALDRLMVRVASVVSAPFPLHVQVTDDARVNSFAVSGGSIIIFRGMLSQVKSPEEFAGLLAHEVAHTALRHPVEGMIRTLGLSFLMSAFSEDLSELAFSSAAFKEKMLSLTYSTDNEAAADAATTEILSAASLSNAGAISLFNRLRQGRFDQGTFSARHAEAGQRLKLSEVKSGSGSALTAADWQALQNICSEKIQVR